MKEISECQEKSYHQPAIPYVVVHRPPKLNILQPDGGSRTYQDYIVSRYKTSTSTLSYPLQNNRRQSYERVDRLSKSFITYKIMTKDTERLKEMDDLYMVTQMHRRQYRDRTVRVKPRKFFQNPALIGECILAEDIED